MPTATPRLRPISNGRRIHLNNLGIRCHVGRTAKTNGKVLFASKQQDNVGFANLGGSSIQAALKKSEDVRVIVRDQAARLLFRQHRQAGGFDESLQRHRRREYNRQRFQQ